MPLEEDPVGGHRERVGSDAITPRYLKPDQLELVWQQLAAQGNACAAMRLAALHAKRNAKR